MVCHIEKMGGNNVCVCDTTAETVECASTQDRTNDTGWASIANFGMDVAGGVCDAGYAFGMLGGNLARRLTGTDAYWGEGQPWRRVGRNLGFNNWFHFEPVLAAVDTVNLMGYGGLDMALGHAPNYIVNELLGLNFRYFNPAPDTVRGFVAEMTTFGGMLVGARVVGALKGGQNVSVAESAKTTTITLAERSAPSLAPRKVGAETTTITRAESSAPSFAPIYVMDYTDPAVSAQLTGNPGRIITASVYPNYPEGMLIRGWRNVEHALRNYENVKGSAATTNDLVNANMQTFGPLGAGLILRGIKLGAERCRDFMGKMLAEADAAIGKEGRWRGSYDYEALGTPFFKTIVDIAQVGNDLFTLRINAAYVGTGPEVALAKAIRSPRVLKSVSIPVSLEPFAESPTFVVNFGDILGRLERVLGKPRVTGEGLARSAAKVSQWEDIKPVVVYENSDFTVEIGLGAVERPRHGQNLFSVEGCQVSGACYRLYYSDREYHHVPTITITVKFAEGGEYVPINYPSLLDLAERIRQAFTAEERALPPPEGRLLDVPRQ